MTLRAAFVACLAAAMSLMAMIGVAHADRLAQAKARGVLVCGHQNASEPYGFQDGETRTFVGYDVDMCGAMAKGLGLRLETVPLSTEARIPELKLGRVDVVAGSLAYMPTRAEIVDYSLQYLQSTVKVMVRADSPIRTHADLAGKRVCASKGSSTAAFAEKVLPDSRIMTFQDVAACNLALESGKVEAFSAGELILKRFAINAAKAGHPYRLLDEPIAVEHVGVVVDKGEPELLAALNGVIRQMDASGELDAIFERWIGKESIYGLTRTFKVEPVNPGAEDDRGSSAFDLGFLITGSTPDKLMAGVAVTLRLFVTAWIGAFAAALVIVGLRAIPFPPLNVFMGLFVEYHRNVPTVVQILVWYFGVPALLPAEVRAWINQGQSEFFFAAVALSLNVSAYFSEDIRSGLRAIPATQNEAARAIGLSALQAMRYVTVPQAVRIGVPPLLNRTLILFKDTSLAMVIGVTELTYQVKAIENLTFRSFEVFAFATAAYLAVSLVIMGLGGWFGRRFPPAFKT